jgi:hypothetical protein
MNFKIEIYVWLQMLNLAYWTLVLRRSLKRFWKKRKAPKISIKSLIDEGLVECKAESYRFDLYGNKLFYGLKITVPYEYENKIEVKVINW